MKLIFQTRECGRCGGTGHHQFNPMDGTVCFECRGACRVLSKTGAAARAAFDELVMERCGRPVQDVKVGDKVWEKSDRGLPFSQFPRSGYHTVIKSCQTPHDPKRWSIGYPPKPSTPDETRGHGYFIDTLVRVQDIAAETQVMREVAAAHPKGCILQTGDNEAEVQAFLDGQSAADTALKAKNERARERSAARAKKAQDAKTAQQLAERDAWRRKNPDLAAFADSVDLSIPGYDRDPAATRLMDLAASAQQRALTDKQTELFRADIKRAEERERERAASTYFGTVGTRAVITATLEARIDLHRKDLSNRSRYLVILTESETGAALKTFTTGSWIWDLDKGDAFTFSALIEKHGEYQGSRETHISDVRIRKGK